MTTSSDTVGLSDLGEASEAFYTMVASRTSGAAKTIRSSAANSGGRAKPSKAERERGRRDIHESIQSMSDVRKERVEAILAIADRVEESDALFTITALVGGAKKNELSGSGKRFHPHSAPCLNQWSPFLRRPDLLVAASTLKS